MKKSEKEVLRSKLFTAVNRVLRDNKNELKNKTVRAIDKSIRHIVRKTDKKGKAVAVKSRSAKASSGK